MKIPNLDYWIHLPFNCKFIAYQIPYHGYIPFYPYGGRYIMDDFGNLVQALPDHYH